MARREQPAQAHLLSDAQHWNSFVVLKERLLLSSATMRVDKSIFWVRTKTFLM